MTSFSVQVNVDRAAVERFRTDPGGAVMAYLARLGNQVSNLSAQFVNVDTGYLRSSREVVSRPSEGVVEVAYRAEYARFVHDGTVYMEGNPYLTDALEIVLGR